LENDLLHARDLSCRRDDSISKIYPNIKHSANAKGCGNTGSDTSSRLHAIGVTGSALTAKMCTM